MAVQFDTTYKVTASQSPHASVHALSAGTDDPSGSQHRSDSIDGSWFSSGCLQCRQLRRDGTATVSDVTDRIGNKFEGPITRIFRTDAGNCPGTSADSHPSVPTRPSMTTAGGRYDCSADSPLPSLVTDSNGNQITFELPAHNAPIPVPIPWEEHLLFERHSRESTDGTTVRESLGDQPKRHRSTYYHATRTASTRSIKSCYSVVPIQTAFNVVAWQKMQLFRRRQLPGLVTVIQADGSYWVFSYDNYEDLTSHPPAHRWIHRLRVDNGRLSRCPNGRPTVQPSCQNPHFG